jgi:hypothetical protein
MTLHRRVSAGIGVASGFVKYTFRMISFFGKTPYLIELFPASGRNAREKFRKTQNDAGIIVGARKKMDRLHSPRPPREPLSTKATEATKCTEEDQSRPALLPLSVLFVASVAFVISCRA